MMIVRAVALQLNRLGQARQLCHVPAAACEYLLASHYSCNHDSVYLCSCTRLFHDTATSRSRLFLAAVSNADFRSVKIGKQRQPEAKSRSFISARPRPETSAACSTLPSIISSRSCVITAPNIKLNLMSILASSRLPSRYWHQRFLAAILQFHC
jgi:hypothetical protein